jgi:hypothetical protein
MTDMLALQREIQALRDQLERLRKADAGAIYLHPTQLLLLPVALAASPADFAFTPQPWPCLLLANHCSVFVATTNNGANYWTVELYDVAGTLLANPNTSAIAANTWTRLNPTAGAQPASTSARFYYKLIASGSPGAIYAVPTLAVLRTGN